MINHIVPKSILKSYKQKKKLKSGVGFCSNREVKVGFIEKVIFGQILEVSESEHHRYMRDLFSRLKCQPVQMPWGGRIPGIRRAQRLECNEGGRRLDDTRKVTASRSSKSFLAIVRLLY